MKLNKFRNAKKGKVRYGLDLYSQKFQDGFDPWDGVREEIHFYWVYTDGNGKKMVRQGCDFYRGSECDWTMCVYPSDATVDPREYRKVGSDAFNSFDGPIDLIDLNEADARKKYFALLRSNAYLPIEKIQSRTRDDMYWFRMDLPPYSKR